MPAPGFSYSVKLGTIGLRQAPCPDGQPGHVRVDTVHLGDLDGVKGI